jgi:hypothetical protein
MSKEGTSGQAPSAPMPSQLVKAFIKYEQNINKINWPSSTSYDELTITGFPSCEAASKFNTSPEFRTAISSEITSLIAIRLLINDTKENFKSEDAEKPNKFEFGDQTRVVVSFELIESGRKVIHWKNDHKSQFLSLDLNDDQYSKALTDLVFKFITSALKSNCTGGSQRDG